MSIEGHRDLPEPEDFPVREAPDRDAVELVDQAEDELLTTQSDVTTEDLSTDDLIDNGALPEDLERSQFGAREAAQDMVDPSHDDTIDERVRQEEYDPNSAVVPPQLRDDR
ncbi:hypothetical protein [Aestuariimicrobium ganziense]|uniref:hypothetical protein n=1 Tax=Aestuariimicrobium ganziense TaxID=2773677 RepID=UPI001943DFF7|nr:hypothetical protein [Aestuariimicrobium ganziense]